MSLKTPSTALLSPPQPTVGSGRLVLRNLAAIIDAKTTSERDRQVATGQRIAREFQAYGHLSAQANASGDPRAYLKAYLSYYDSLSPEEQQTARYRGTREGALKGLSDTAASLAQAVPARPVVFVPAEREGSQRASIFPNAELMSGLRSLLGIIEKTRHPDHVAPTPIANVDFKA